MVWDVNNAISNESPKCRFDIVRYTRGVGLDIGCGIEKVFPHAIGIDSDIDVELFNKKSRADIIVKDGADLRIFASQEYDWVFSSHLLEHIVDYKAALKEWWRLVKQGGYLVLYLPHKDFYPNIGHEHANPDHKHDFVNKDIVDAMLEVGKGGWDLVVNQERNERDEYSFLQVYKKTSNHEFKFSCEAPKPKKTAAVVRYGAYGDAIQCSGVVAELKAQGYHVTFYCTPRALEVIKEDPNIDDFYIQDRDQVPNHLLQFFWEWEMRKYDKWVNLTQTTETQFLLDTERPVIHWPKELRHKLCNHNYVQVTYESAGLKYDGKPKIKFYPTLKEKNWAHDQIKKWGATPLVVFSLSGSSPHKVWPHMDQLIARILLEFPKSRIVLVGAEHDQILEDPWRNEHRVTCFAGEISIRKAITLAQMADFVVGTETGVMNAISMESVPKACILSHSSHENLTRDWVNTFAVFSTITDCYPCHILHRSFDYCPQSFVHGTAQCAEDIPADAVWAAFIESRKEAA